MRKLIHIIFTLIALTIIVDFVFFEKIRTEKVVSTKTKLQNYYNAAGNSHYSYKVVTNSNEFYISEKFEKSIKKRQQIDYSVSSIFNKVNWYKLTTSKSKSYYSLRVITGLIIPLLTILSLIVVYTIHKKIDILAFVLQVLLMADLIFLIL